MVRIEHERYFRDYVVPYTNAATIVSEDFRDTEDLDGLFSGYDPAKGGYDPTSWPPIRARRSSRSAAPPGRPDRSLRQPAPDPSCEPSCEIDRPACPGARRRDAGCASRAACGG